jgi:hypothetical protein
MRSCLAAGSIPQVAGCNSWSAGFFVAILVSACGVVPFIWGFDAIFVAHSFCIFPSECLLEARLAVCGIPLWVCRYPGGTFERITIHHWQAGFPVARSRYLVSVEGSSRRVRISSYDERAAAEHFASSLAADLALPLHAV